MAVQVVLAAAVVVVAIALLAQAVLQRQGKVMLVVLVLQQGLVMAQAVAVDHLLLVQLEQALLVVMVVREQRLA
jgi:hypothetical protein